MLFFRSRFITYEQLDIIVNLNVDITRHYHAKSNAIVSRVVIEDAWWEETSLYPIWKIITWLLKQMKKGRSLKQ